MSRRAVGHPPMKLAARQWHKRRPCAEEAGLCPLQWQPGRLPATFGGRERVTHSRAATALGLRRNTPSGGRTLSPSRPARSLWLRHPPHRLQPDPAPLPDDHRRRSGAVASAAAAPRCRRPPPGAVEAPRGCLRQPPLPPVPPPAGGGGRASCVVVLLCPTGWPPPRRRLAVGWVCAPPLSPHPPVLLPLPLFPWPSSLPPLPPLPPPAFAPLSPILALPLVSCRGGPMRWGAVPPLLVKPCDPSTLAEAAMAMAEAAAAAVPPPPPPGAPPFSLLRSYGLVRRCFWQGA